MLDHRDELVEDDQPDLYEKTIGGDNNTPPMKNCQLSPSAHNPTRAHDEALRDWGFEYPPSFCVRVREAFVTSSGDRNCKYVSK